MTTEANPERQQARVESVDPKQPSSASRLAALDIKNNPSPLSDGELVDLLNWLLEDIRAEARITAEIEQFEVHRNHRALFRHLRTEQVRSIVLLLRHIERLGGQASVRTGALGEFPPFSAPIALQIGSFNDRQRRLHMCLHRALPRITHEPLRTDLSDLEDRHSQCIRRCTALASA